MTVSKEDIKQIIEDTIQSKVDEIHTEIGNLQNAINRDMKLTYLSAIARTLELEAAETVANFSCSYHSKTEKACKNLLSEYIGKYTNALAMGDLAEGFSILSEFSALAEKNSQDADKVGGCRSDWLEIHRILARHREVANDISAKFSARAVPKDIGEIDFNPDELYENVIFPLSHPLRIQIIHALKTGSKRFTNLKNELKVKNTGLLVHHLKPLTESNLVIQDYKKEYSLSDKGFLVARYFAQITAAMHPEEPVTIEIQPLVVLQDK